MCVVVFIIIKTAETMSFAAQCPNCSYPKFSISSLDSVEVAADGSGLQNTSRVGRVDEERRRVVSQHCDHNV